MNRIFLFLLLGLLAACSADEEPQDASEEIEDDCCSGAEEAAEEAEEVEDMPEVELNVDSISHVYQNLEEKYISLDRKLNDSREDYYCLSRSTFDVYSGGTENWYFDKNFKLAYYESEFGAEGGYSELEFWKVRNDQFEFIFYEESEADNPTTTIQTYDENGNVQDLAAMHMDYYASNQDDARTYKIPEVLERTFMFEAHLGKVEPMKFTQGKQYEFEDSKMVHSEYEGETLAGYRLKIDSALFIYVYNLKSPESHEAAE